MSEIVRRYEANDRRSDGTQIIEEQRDERADSEVSAEGDGVKSAYDAMVERSRDAWKTGKKWDRRAHQTRDGKTSPDYLARLVSAWEKNGRKGPKPTDEVPDPTASSQTPARGGDVPVDPTDLNTPEEFDYGPTNAAAGEGDEVAKARAAMIARSKNAWKKSRDKRR